MASGPAARVSPVANRIMPSLLSADFANLQRSIETIPSADALHVDVMDYHFVPNLTIGLPVMEAIRQITDKLLDLHLMIEDPDRWAPTYAEQGAESVTFHIEAADAPVRLARELRSRGARAGMALKPATPIEPYADLLPELDLVLIMTVEPGFGGQSFLDLCLPKIERTRALLERTGGDIWLQVDGGVSAETIERCAAAGADSFVAGSAVFGADDPDAMVTQLRQLADTPHTRPVPVTSTSRDPDLMETYGIAESSYEGPTGITGVMADLLARAGLPTISVWAAIPHYVSHPPCPKATLAILSQLERLLDTPLDVGELPELARAWERGVTELAAEDSEVAEYVSQLEEQTDATDLPEASGDAIAAEFERYLKRRQGG